MNILFYIKIIIKNILCGIVKLLFCFVRSRSNAVFVIPEETALHEPYCISNYTGDNVLFFLHYIIIHHDIPNTRFKYVYVVCLNADIKAECLKLQMVLKYIKIIPVAYPHKAHCYIAYIKYFFNFFKCQTIITSNVMEPLRLKRKKQIDICLVYYPAPFKSDVMTHLMSVKYQTQKYVISASDFAARMDAVASHVPFCDYKILGFIRHDNIVKPRFDKQTIKKLIKVSEDIKNIVVYTPTHRDGKIDKSHTAIMGCVNYDKLDSILKITDSILIIKCHSGMLDDKILDINDCERILLYQPSIEYTFYDILPHADLLITDYTSTYFDFLVTGKPVIFTFCDFSDYEKNRGLSYNPVDLFCAGKTIYTENELFCAIENELCGNTYKNAKHYNDIRDLFVKYKDGKTCERVYDFICSQIK